MRDTGGGVVPGATVTVTNMATNIESHQVTTDTGAYQVVNLVPGRYQVEVELSGFKKSSQVVDARSRPARPPRRRARGRRALRDGDRVRNGAAAQHQRRDAGRGHSADAGGEPAAGDPQLGRPAGARSRRAGRSLHRAGRRHVVRPHRRHQRARRPRAAEQLSARRRRQQQHLRERPGADLAGVAAVGRRDSGIQGGHQPVLGGIRPVAGRRGQRLDQVGHQRGSRARATTTSATRSSTPSTTSRARRTPPSRPTIRTSTAATSAARSSRTRRSSSATSKGRGSRRASSAHGGADGQRARRHLHVGGAGSAHRPAVRQQPDSGRPHRSVRGRDHRPGAAAEPAGRQQLLPHRRPGRQRRPPADPSRLEADRPATASSAATSTRTAPARSRAPSAASSTAPARRRSATRRSRPTRWSAAGPR